MRQNQTLARLRSGQPALGLWLYSHSFHIARMIAAQGLFDWLLLDMEHSPVDLHTASTIFAGIADISAGQCTPLVRVARGTMDQIKHALDFGAQGILVPMVNTAQDAADIVRFTRYAPDGERGAGGVLPHFSYGTTSHLEYIKHANREVLLAIQIETREAVENIDAILDTPGIDLVFIGPFDLQVSLGLSGGLWGNDPVFLAAVDRIITACRKRGLPYGTVQANADLARDRLAQGFTFVGVGTDLGQLITALTAQVRALRPASGA